MNATRITEVHRNTYGEGGGNLSWVRMSYLAITVCCLCGVCTGVISSMDYRLPYLAHGVLPMLKVSRLQYVSKNK